MAKKKKKIVFNKKLSDQKKAFRTPVSKPTTWFKDKSKYDRKKNKELKDV